MSLEKDNKKFICGLTEDSVMIYDAVQSTLNKKLQEDTEFIQELRDEVIDILDESMQTLNDNCKEQLKDQIDEFIQMQEQKIKELDNKMKIMEKTIFKITQINEKLLKKQDKIDKFKDCILSIIGISFDLIVISGVIWLITKLFS
ncbi:MULTISPECIES: hypothetical protein [unclassified Campylobacter]|uniref:hypothetical protein n=1 Tax=unclassified Campylobacter TaxID=2593542 RepID=UPI0012381B25|nr:MULTISPECIES: hypothetical protein [unclassified Campylobacter]KAA6225906.1 hypothetical protein FMM55_05625 [Campylobacter sp. LR196d]KAA6226987.1 hypothetical protein FMM54_03215 [Campylobacter sp. LR185c]KAA6228861.1 hypothetical protein FMM57_02095 [Campylobacter sp. LR286c]KAA6230029.1 hypothetical protein FMM56_07000 [Campylobacter sp. LR264d]KAA6233436.1 hypothetical protein FMM58_02195 [Campylobacter sp. LR291e]